MADDFDLDSDVCECGVPIAEHPPLPKPPPLTSWHTQKVLSTAATWDGRPIEERNARLVQVRRKRPAKVAATRQEAPS